MSEHAPHKNRPGQWLFPVIFLAIIAVLALYIVRDNFNERVPVTESVNKDTRSDKMDSIVVTTPQVDTTVVGNAPKTDTIGTNRERASAPELDTLKK